MRMHHTVIFGLPGSTIFFHIISQTAPFPKRLLNIKFLFRFSVQLLYKTFIILQYDQKCLHVKYTVFLSDCNETRTSRHIFEKYLNIKFDENLSSGGGGRIF
jgi:hypothetical protein